MAWQTDITNLVRVLINDLSETPTYSDDRIIQTITVAARYIQFDVNLDTKYTVDSINLTISPDPTDSGSKDEIFNCLLGLKTACIIDQSTFRTKAVNHGITAALGPAKLSVANMDSYRYILEQGPCKTYNELTEHWDVANANAISAVLSPFVGNKFDPFMLMAYDNYRHKSLF